MTALHELFDAVLFDLDGVLYLGPDAVPEAPATVEALAMAGKRLAYVTNNASRRPDTVATHLTELGMSAAAEDVVTSAQAIATVAARELPAGADVFLLGSDALGDELRGVGLHPVREADAAVQAVVQGYDPQLSVGRIQDACALLHAGLPWFASNLDLTIPSERGLFPGMGSYVNLIAAAVERRPDAVAGKPYPPLLTQTMARVRAERPVFVGDRLDTDVAGARAVGIPALFVLTGAHRKRELLAAVPAERPDYLGGSVAALLEGPRRGTAGAEGATCGEQRAWVEGGTLRVSVGATKEEQLDGLWAAALVAWRAADDGRAVDTDDAMRSLQLLP